MRHIALALALVACGNNDEDKATDTDTDEPADTDLPYVEDVFPQELISPVDILWVVDPGWSEGMDQLEEALDKGYETLLLADPDWQFGVLDATVEPQTSNFGLIGAKFQTWPPPPTAFDFGAPDGPPRVRDTLYAALEQRRDHDRNADFLRSDAHLYVLVYTDQEDRSADADLTRVEWRSWFEGLQPSESKRLGALVDDEVRGYWDDQLVGDATVTVATKPNDFKKGVPAVLREAMGQRTEFVLTQLPTAPIAEVKVVYREHKQVFEEGEYTFSTSRNAIIFEDYVPPVGSEVHVTYEGVPFTADEPTAGTTPPDEE
jgi:hypothetical protein